MQMPPPPEPVSTLAAAGAPDGNDALRKTRRRSTSHRRTASGGRACSGVEQQRAFLLRQGGGGSQPQSPSRGPGGEDVAAGDAAQNAAAAAAAAAGSSNGGGTSSTHEQGSARRAVDFLDVTDPTPAATAAAVAAGVPAPEAEATTSSPNDLLSNDQGALRVANEAKLKAEEREASQRRRQQDALIMLRNIPFVEVNVVAAVELRPGQQEGGTPGEANHSSSGRGASSDRSPSTSAGAGGRGTYIGYRIEMGVPKDVYRHGTHTVWHRYSRFAALHEALTKAWGDKVRLPKLPPKVYTLSKLTPKQVEERRVGLDTYLEELVTVLNFAVEPNLRSFLECDRWLKERKTAKK